MKMNRSEKFFYKFTVEQGMLDEYGHVNNARYLTLFEEARWDILKKSGFGPEMVRKSMTGPVILEINIRFSRELLPGQIIQIETTSRRKNELVMYFDQVMLNEDGKIACKALFTSALFDLEKRKMIRPDEKWLKAFGFI